MAANVENSINGSGPIDGMVLVAGMLNTALLKSVKVEQFEKTEKGLVASERVDVRKEDIQPIGVEATSEQAVAFAEAITPMGVVRFAQIARMLNIEMPRDGIVLIDRLVKWNILMGSLV